MTKAQRKRALWEALKKLAGLFPGGHLKVISDPAGFILEVIEEIESLRELEISTTRVKKASEIPLTWPGSCN